MLLTNNESKPCKTYNLLGGGNKTTFCKLLILSVQPTTWYQMAGVVVGEHLHYVDLIF